VRRVLRERLTLTLTLTRCVREARGRAIVEAEAAEQAAANVDKSAAKAVPANTLEPLTLTLAPSPALALALVLTWTRTRQAKKEKLRLEAASRRERLKKDKGGERSSAGSVTKEVDNLALRSGDTSEGSDDARSRGGSAPQTPDRKSSPPTGSREEPGARRRARGEAHQSLAAVARLGP